MADPVPWTLDRGGDYTEEVAWLTDVMQAPTGGTQHRRLRQSPRTFLAFSALESGARRRWMEVLLRAHGAASWWAPVSIDAAALDTAAAAADTVLAVTGAGARRFVVGGHALVLGPDARRHELCEVAAVAANAITLADGLTFDWPAGTEVVPVRRAHLAETPQVGRFTSDDTALVPIRFRLDEPLDTDPVPPATAYRGYPVFDGFPPVWTADPLWVPERQIHHSDIEVGPVFVADLAGVAMGRTTMQHAATTAAEVAAFRGALFALAGRWSPAWVPSWAHDLRVVANVSASATTLDVAGPLLSGRPIEPNHRDLRIALADGTVLYRRISAVTAQSDSVDRITLGAALPAFTAAQVQMVSFLTLSVQDSDTNLLRYVDRTAMQCELTWRELDHEL
ncbi:MAG: hypothetical protein LCH59_06610 [Proteobacteria bacterium]|nr:hypothetical protein [Pseudomonadota bacterium]